MALIGLISDVHSSPEPVAEALSIFVREGVDQVFCAGDIAGYMDQLEPTISLLGENNCRVVRGNHDLMYLDKHKLDADNETLSYLKQLPAFIDVVIEGKKLYMVHAQPPDGCHGGIKLRDREGILQAERIELWKELLAEFNYDVLVVGHTHQVYAEFIGNILVVNPGSSVFNYSCAILQLPEMTVQFFPLSGKSIKNTWNWAEYMLSVK
ncbi:MAG: metallophosphatase family protein [Gammaproteobacteria bacterium]|jgi:putative phosphoesterase|nr:metallophosphatase family protein [Gammaproteobacteria bacterium]